MLDIALCTIGCGLLCYTLGRYNRALTLERWHFVLNLPGRRAVAALREQMELDAALARQALEAANRAREAGRLQEAVRVLQAALAVLEDAGSDRLTRLRGMKLYSRMLRAIQPLPTPSPAPFRSGRLRLLAAATGVVHQFLVGSTERFRLWLLMLGYGVRIVLHGARESSTSARQAPQLSRPWACFAEGLEDFHALDASHLTAFEALSASLAAIESAQRARLWDSIVNP